MYHEMYMAHALSVDSNGDITRDKDRLLKDDPETKEI